MIKTKKPIILLFDLQLFADGGGGTGGADGASGVSAGVPSPQQEMAGQEVVYGKPTSSGQSQVANETKAEKPANPVDLKTEFEELIKGKFKDVYGKKVEETVVSRLKSTKDTVENYKALSPLLELLSEKYGVKASDINALVRAVEEDESYYSDEAMELGVSVEHLKEQKKLQRENKELKAQLDSQMEEANAKKIYSTWIKEAEEAKLKYPGLNLETEIQNKDFSKLLESGIDVETAYFVVHRNEIFPAVMQHAGQVAEEKLSKSIASNQARPRENGTNSVASALVKSDVSALTHDDFRKIREKVARGEKISF